MLRARSAGESAFWIWRGQPSAEIVRVEGAKCRRECVLGLSGVTLCGDRACRGREMQVILRFGPVRRNPLRRSCVSSARNAGENVFWIGRAPFFGGSLVRNARFGDLALHFWRKSRTKRSFWRLGASLLEEVSYVTLVLETWRLTGSCVTLVLETWRFTFGGSLVRDARFGDLALHLRLRSGQFVVQM